MLELPDESSDTGLYDLAYNSLIELSTGEGINASGKEEIYGCIFGRDSAITILKILRAHEKKPSLKLLEICRKGILALVSLQGKELNIESGEEPGKFIHEFRKDESQIARFLNLKKPWFIYPDGLLRNYDSIDSTPLSLIAIYKYWQATGDSKFLMSVLPAVEEGLNWLLTFGDKDNDAFIEYELPTRRIFGGLPVQSWTDSVESLIQPNGSLPKYPIAPVEAQAYAWLALKLWSDYFSERSKKFARKMRSQAKQLKERFNNKFILENGNYAAQALDGNKNPINTITANPMLCLWAAYKKGNKSESIVKAKYIKDFVKRAFQSDMFLEDAGIRTMSSLSSSFNPNQDSYHNGSFWPVLNSMVAEGLENFGFLKESKLLSKAALAPIRHFGCPIELYIKKEGQFLEYRSASGQSGCRVQAWSAAALLDFS